MSKRNLLKIGIFFLLSTSLLSCSDEDSGIYLENKLIGEWQLNDPENHCTHTLVFDLNKTGIEIIGCEYPDSQYISSAESFKWETEKDMLTIDFFGEKTKSSFSFNKEGHLFLPNITDTPEMYFIRIK